MELHLGESFAPRHTFVQILLVGEDEKQTVLHFAIVDDAVQFLASLVHTNTVTRVDNEDKTLSTCRKSAKQFQRALRPQCLEASVSRAQFA